ncbi:MAG: GNAT family N-acetyltransferase [Acidimicrobiales bacterium]
MSPLPIPTLTGPYTRLEPLGPEHIDALVEAANEDRATYFFTSVPQNTREATQFVETMSSMWESGGAMPFAQIDVARERVVGTTRYLNIRRSDDSSLPYGVEIGGTWLAASTQRTRINTNAKLLLLDYAFTTFGVGRVDLKTDARNERSRAAIARIGATFEGVLRHWQPSLVPREEGKLRDTAIFSILDLEWPDVRELLLSKLDHYAAR